MKIKMSFFLLLMLSLTSCNQQTNIDRFTVKYSEPYFAINLLERTPIYKEPSEASQVVYELEKYRIVRMKASISLKKPTPIWYEVEESDFHGYSLMSNFKLFDTLKEAESFLLDRHPQKDMLPMLSSYKQAEKDYLKGDYFNSITKLYRFINIKKDIIKNYPSLYYTTFLLIGKLYIKGKEYQKAVLHFDQLLHQPIIHEKIFLLGSYFNPHEINFHTQEVENYLRKKAFIQFATKLKWELYYSLGRGYEGLNNSKKGKNYYNKILFEKTPPDLKDNKILYINHSIDQMASMGDGKQRIALLQYLQKRLSRQNEMRYLYYKVATLFESVTNKNIKQSQKMALANYKYFVTFFEKKGNKNPYPGEMSHYLSAKERIKMLREELKR